MKYLALILGGLLAASLLSTGCEGENGTDGLNGVNGEAGPNGPPGANGQDGTNGESCTVEAHDGSFTMTCPDGTSVTWQEGEEPEAHDGGADSFLQDDGGAPDSSLEDAGTLGCEGPSVLEGSVLIQNDEDILRVACYTTITGNLTIDAPGLTTLVLPALTTIGGDLTSGTVTLTSIGLPSLTRVGGELTLYNMAESIAHIDLSALVEVSGALTFYGAGTNPGLSVLASVGGTLTMHMSAVEGAYIDLPSLTTVLGDLDLRGATDINLPQLALIQGSLPVDTRTLVSLNLPNLVTVGELAVLGEGGLGAIVDIKLPSLSNVLGGLDITDNPSLVELDLQALTTIGEGGGMPVGYLDITNNDVLTSIDLPAFTAGTVVIRDNDALVSINLPSLATGSLIVQNNATLCQSVVNAIVAQLRALGWEGDLRVAGGLPC